MTVQWDRDVIGCRLEVEPAIEEEQRMVEERDV